MEKELLQTFWSLSEGDEHHRILATSTLIDILKEKQRELQAPSRELDYTLQRLIKGLTSPRKWARLGYSSAFTQLLRSPLPITAKTVLEVITEKLKVIGSDTKSEQSNTYLGQTLAYLAVIHSNKFLEADGNDLSQLVKNILRIKKKKGPLHHLCTEALIKLIKNVPAGDFSEHVWPQLRDDLEAGWAKASPDSLLLLMSASTHQPDKLDKKFMQSHWDAKTFLSEKNFKNFASVLSQSTCDHPIIHPVCTQLLTDMSRKPAVFTAFWKNVIYGKVFPSGSQRKYLVFELIPEALKLATTEEEVFAILNPNLVGCVIQNLNSKQHALYGASKKLLENIVQASMKLSDEFQVVVTTCLITSPGTVMFDNIVKTRSISKLLLNLSPAGVKLMSRKLMDNIKGTEITRPYEEEDEAHRKSADLVSQQKWSIRTLTSFISQSIVNTDMEWCKNLLEFLASSAFFDVEKATKSIKKPPCSLDDAVRHELSTAFFRVLDRMAKYMGKGTKGFQAYTSTLHHIAHYTKTLIDNENLKLSRPLSSQVLGAWDKMVLLVNKIKKKREKMSVGQNDEMAFEMLFLHHGLQLFSEAKPAMEVLEELHTCYEKASQKKRRRSTVVGSEAEPEWVDVVVDLLLSLLSQDSHLVRTVVNTVFTMLCPHLTANSLQLILDVLKHDSSSEDNPLDFEDDEEEDMDEEVEDASDSEEESSSEDENSSSEDEDSAEEEEKTVDENLRQSVKSALGDAADDADSPEESTESDLDDEAMFRLDNALAAVFKNKKRSKTEDAIRETHLQHYRMRCLDLMKIFIEHTASTSLLLDLIYPLLNVMEIGIREKSQKDLGDRATKVFHQLTSTRKIIPDPGLDKNRLPQMVKDLMEHSTKVSLVPLVKEIAAACLFVIRTAQGSDKKTFPSPLRTRAMAAAKVKQQEKDSEEDQANVNQILKIVEEKLNSFILQRESRMSHLFFQTMIQLDPDMFWPLSHTILDHAVTPQVRIFCKTQACVMLSTMITKASIRAIENRAWEEFAGKILKSADKIFRSGSKQTIKPRYQQELLTLIHKVISVLDQPLTQKLVSNDLMEELSRLKSAVDDDGRRLINKICGLYQSRVSASNKSGKDKQKRRRKRSTSPGAKKEDNTLEPSSPKEQKTDVLADTATKAGVGKKNGSPKPTTTDESSTPTRSSSKKKIKKEKHTPNDKSSGSGNYTSVKVHDRSPQVKKEQGWMAASEASDRTSLAFIDRTPSGGDKVKLNLLNHLREADKSSKKRRNSELPPVSSTNSVSSKKKKKRKSMGDV